MQSGVVKAPSSAGSDAGLLNNIERAAVQQAKRRHVTEDRRRSRIGLLGKLVGNDVIESLFRKFAGDIMANLTELRAAAARIGTGISDVQTQITSLASQVDALEGADQAEVDAIVSGLNTAADSLGTAASDIDAIVEPDAGEGEPTPTPGDENPTGPIV